ncbi:retrovirus-related pol polyprotein from transposon TNT 1-94 [Tanacetum coccineum]
MGKFGVSKLWFLFLGVVLINGIADVQAWSKEGHVMTCKIAQDLLEPDAAHAVKMLLPDYVNGNLSALCVWPDQIRHWYRYRWTSPLHFIDTPDDACSFDYSNNMTEALLFLSHFMGDIHQPMHVGFTSDEGGNSIDLRWFRHKSNLHHVWDREIILTASADYYNKDMTSLRKAIQANFTHRIDELTKWKDDKGKGDKRKSDKGLVVEVIEKWTCSKVTLDQLLSEQIPADIGQSPLRKSSPDKNALPLTEQLLLTQMEEVKGIKNQILIPLDTSSLVSQANSSKTPRQKDYLKRYVWYLDSGYSRHMTEVKQYLHRYSNESSPKVVFGDNSSSDTEGYGSVNYNRITFTKVAYVNGLKHNLFSISQLCDANFKVLFTKTQGTIFNEKGKVVHIAPRRRDVYVIDMSSYNTDSNAFFYAKASPSINWLWHKRLSHLNFKTINNLLKYNLASGLPSLTFSKDKNCSTCDKGKHHRATFKTKRSFFINKCLHILYIDMFGLVKPQTISHNKYTLVIVDEYSRYTWVFCLKKKSDAADCIMSFIRQMEN